MAVCAGSEMTAILGISAFYHDSAAALVRDGELIAAAQEGRFTRRKHGPKRVRIMQDDPDLRNRVNVVRSEVPAITHVDSSARIQTVDAGRNPRFHRLLEAF